MPTVRHRVESSYEATFARRVERLGLRALKLQRLPGWPDRLVLLPGGNVVFCELKRPGQRLRKLQAHRRSELERNGYLVLVIDGMPTLDAAMQLLARAIGDKEVL